MAEQVLTEEQQITNEWREFSNTLAYRRFIEHIEMQKSVYNVMASGPVEIYEDVPTFDGKTTSKLSFEPEKYAYLLQRSVGCDIVKIYVEGYTIPLEDTQRD